MYAYITCMCGRPIGDIDDLFTILKKIIKIRFMTENDIDTDPALLSIDEDTSFELGEILDMLNIKAECCRKSMLASVKFDEIA